MRKLFRILLLVAILSFSFALPFTQQLVSPQVTEAALLMSFNAADYCYWSESSAISYIAAHDSATGVLYDSGTQTDVGQRFSAGTYIIYRAGYRFNTAGLPDDAVISSAILSFPVQDWDSLSASDFATCNGTGLAYPFTTAGYGTLLTSTTSFVSSTTGTATTMTVTLNATGIAEINNAGYTMFGMRMTDDILANAPLLSYTWAVFSATPQLQITYTCSPTISTSAATSVTMSTARLNASVTRDGGLSCYVRFQYGLTAAYGIDTSWVSGYTTGSAPYVSISGLTESTLYHFRAQIYNAVVGEGAPANGLDATFTTGTATAAGSAFGRPLNLTAIPLSSVSVLLNWEKGSLAQKTKVQYSTSDFPTDYNAGTTAYFDEYSSVVVDNLTAGTTYYWSAWSYTPGDNVTGIDYWSDYEPTTLDYVLDAGSTTLLCTDNAMLFTDEQYYRGCYAHNITAGNEERLIIDYDGATYTSTLASAIAGQVATDTWYVILRCDAVCTTPSSTADWSFPNDNASFLEPVTTKLTNFPMHEIVTLWCSVSGMDYADAWVFWGMIVTTVVGVAVALVSESALLTIVAVIVIMAGGYFLGVFALWFMILYVVLSVPLGWALAKW